MRYITLSMLFLFAWGCQVGKKAVVVDPSKPLEKCLLWKIEGKGVKKPSYLYGTIHIIPTKDFFITNPSLKAFSDSKALVLELDMSNEMKMAFQMLRLAPMNDGKKLKDLLSEEDYALTKDYFEKDNKQGGLMGFKMLETWKPMLLQSLMYESYSSDPTVSYELKFVEMAKKQKISIGGLEGVEDQMQVFDKIPYKDQAEMLVDAIKELKKGKEKQEEDTGEFAKLVKIYKDQNIEGMVGMLAESKLEVGEKALLEDRNKNWIPKIIERIKKEQTFFAVGAAHLGGPVGVIRLLRAEGFVLTPLFESVN